MEPPSQTPAELSIPVRCPQISTPWPLTLADVQDVHADQQPNVLYTKRMRVNNENCSVKRFVICTPRTSTHGAQNKKTIARLERAAKRRAEYVEPFDMCENCNEKVAFIRKDASCACTRCGISKDYQEPDTSYREGVQYSVPYLYKKSNHFRDHLKRVTGRESTVISPWILNAVTAELHKRTTDFSKVTPEDIRNILKMLRQRHRKDDADEEGGCSSAYDPVDPMLRQSSLYNHTVRIWALTTKQQPLQISQVQETELLHLFNVIQQPWLKRKPPGRKNFLSYSYILNKLCNMLGYTELAQQFKLLKSRHNIQGQDQMWQNICSELDGFEFVRSTM